MAAFRGTVEGNRGLASKLGSNDSGITTTANSWKHKTRTYVGLDDCGKECVMITVDGVKIFNEVYEESG